MQLPRQMLCELHWGDEPLDDGLTLAECGMEEEAVLKITQKPALLWGHEAAVVEIGADGWCCLGGCH